MSPSHQKHVEEKHLAFVFPPPKPPIDRTLSSRHIHPPGTKAQRLYDIALRLISKLQTGRQM
eukprot:406350-Amphidinium_carterae.1